MDIIGLVAVNFHVIRIDFYLIWFRLCIRVRYNITWSLLYDIIGIYVIFRFRRFIRRGIYVLSGILSPYSYNGYVVWVRWN